MTWTSQEKKLALGLLTGFTVMALLSSTQPYLTSGSSRTWFAYLTGHLTHWYLWALLMPLIYKGGAWLLKHTWHWSVLALVLLLLSGPFAIVHSGLEYGIFEAFPSIRGVYPRVSFSSFIERHLPTDTLTFGLLAGLVVTVQYVQRYNDQVRQTQQMELRAATLTTQLAHAQLQALRMQLHPHFLYNTLQSISTLMYRDAAQADRVLLDLSTLLRLTFERANAPVWSLREEVQWVKHYLTIEAVRFQDRLTIEYALEETVLDAQVPTLIIQPLVENALRHGLNPQQKPGQLRIIATTSAEKLELCVEDTGVGLDPSLGRAGVGLTNTRARLVQHYGVASSLILTPLAPHGCRATLHLPLNRHVSTD